VKILLVDDEQRVHDLYRSELEGAFAGRGAGCRIVSAANAAQALGAFRAAMEQADPFDCAIVDMLMPDAAGIPQPTEGMCVARGIRGHDPDCPVIVLTHLAVVAEIRVAVDDTPGLIYGSCAKMGFGIGEFEVQTLELTTCRAVEWRQMRLALRAAGLPLPHCP
jgi:CheY-like chemotaxis protein